VVGIAGNVIFPSVRTIERWNQPVRIGMVESVKKLTVHPDLAYSYTMKSKRIALAL